METIIIELNQRNADYASKGEYRCKLATPVEINDGDSLAFRMCSLDSNKTDVDTIIIERDQPITGTFSYYDVDYELRDKAGYDQDDPTADPVQWTGNGGNPYFDYFPVYAAPVIVQIDDVQMQIINPSVPAPYGGSFVFDTFTTFGTFIVDPLIQTRFTFSYLDVNSNLQFVTYTGGNAAQVGGVDNNPNFVPYKDQDGNYLYNFALKSLDGTPFQSLQCLTGTFQLASISGNWAGGQWSPSNRTYSAAADPPGKKSGPYDTTYPIQVTDIGIYEITQSPVSTVNFPQLVLKTFNAIIPAGRYAPESLATILTQQLSAANGVLDQRNSAGVIVGNQVYTPTNPFLTRTNLPANSDWIFRYNNFDAGVLSEDITFVPTNTYKYWDFTAENVPSYAIGTDKFSVQFGQAGDVFQVSYMHQPISDPSKPGEEDVALYYTGTDAGTLRYFPVKSASGIAFHQLEPASFWDTKLGLSNKLIVPLCKDAQNTKFYYKTSLEKCVTYGFDSLGTYLFPATELPVTVPPAPYPYTNPRKMLIPPKATVTYFDVTGQSRAIIGETVSINTDGGFFLIEVLSAFRRQGSYIDNRESRPQITAVVSSQYDSNNSITGYSDSGVPFVHHGASYIISDCTIRILNPLTKQPATNLGENNCVWIQVDKAPQAQQLKQPQPQELHTGVQNLAMGVQTDERTRQVEKEQLLHNQLRRTERLEAPGVTELAAQGVERLEQRATLVEPQQSAAKGRAILTPGQKSELLQAMIARKAKAEDDVFFSAESGPSSGSSDEDYQPRRSAMREESPVPMYGELTPAPAYQSLSAPAQRTQQPTAAAAPPSPPTKTYTREQVMLMTRKQLRDAQSARDGNLRGFISEQVPIERVKQRFLDYDPSQEAGKEVKREQAKAKRESKKRPPTGRLPPAPAATAPKPRVPREEQMAAFVARGAEFQLDASQMAKALARQPKTPREMQREKRLAAAPKPRVPREEQMSAVAARDKSAAAKTKIERNEQGQLKFTGPPLKMPQPAALDIGIEARRALVKAALAKKPRVPREQQMAAVAAREATKPA